MISSRPSTKVSNESAPALSSRRLISTALRKRSSPSRVRRWTASSRASLRDSTAREVAVGETPLRARRMEISDTVRCISSCEVTTRSTGSPRSRPDSRALTSASASSPSSASLTSPSSDGCASCNCTQRSEISSASSRSTLVTRSRAAASAEPNCLSFRSGRPVVTVGLLARWCGRAEPRSSIVASRQMLSSAIKPGNPRAPLHPPRRGMAGRPNRCGGFAAGDRI